MIEGWKPRARRRSVIAIEDLKAAAGPLDQDCRLLYEIGWDSLRSGVHDPDPRRRRRSRERPPLPDPAARRSPEDLGHHRSQCPACTRVARSRRSEDGAPVIICEGEWDAIICNQYNFRAVTRTGAARVWKAEWNKQFKGIWSSTSVTTWIRPVRRRTGKVARSLARRWRLRSGSSGSRTRDGEARQGPDRLVAGSRPRPRGLPAAAR
jgi:hypothetical protein